GGGRLRADVLRDRAVVHVAMAGIDVDRMLRIPEGDPIAHYCPPARPRRADYRATVAARQSVVSGPSVPCRGSLSGSGTSGMGRSALACSALPPRQRSRPSRDAPRIYFAEMMI